MSVKWLHVRPSWTPTEPVRSLRRFNEGTNKEHKEETIGWGNEDSWVWEGAPWGMVVVCMPKGAHNLLPLRRTIETRIVFGKGRGNLGACPSSGPVFPWQHVHAREVEQLHKHTHEVSRRLKQRKSTRQGACTQGWGMLVQEMNDWWAHWVHEWAWQLVECDKIAGLDSVDV